MNFTFGIISNNDAYLEQIVNSIENLNIPNYEIIIVGNVSIHRQRVRVINFDPTIKEWITKKKNIITQNALFENIVYLHDYIVFDKNWYNKFLEFGNDFYVCMNQILNSDGTRFRDWCLWPGTDRFPSKFTLPTNDYLIPYHIKHLTKHMYISGSYWVAKKDVMLEFPLNETLSHNEGEDVEWSFRVREKYHFSINEGSIVQLLKWKHPAFNYMTNPDHLNSIIFHN